MLKDAILIAFIDDDDDDVVVAAAASAAAVVVVVAADSCWSRTLYYYFSCWRINVVMSVLFIITKNNTQLIQFIMLLIRTLVTLHSKLKLIKLIANLFDMVVRLS